MITQLFVFGNGIPVQGISVTVKCPTFLLQGSVISLGWIKERTSGMNYVTFEFFKIDHGLTAMATCRETIMAVSGYPEGVMGTESGHSMCFCLMGVQALEGRKNL